MTTPPLPPLERIDVERAQSLLARWADVLDGRAQFNSGSEYRADADFVRALAAALPALQSRVAELEQENAELRAAGTYLMTRATPEDGMGREAQLSGGTAPLVQRLPSLDTTPSADTRRKLSIKEAGEIAVAGLERAERIRAEPAAIPSPSEPNA